MPIALEKAKAGFKIIRHPACAGYSVETSYGTEYDCAYGTTITCEECKYGAGKKDPTAKCNQQNCLKFN